MKPKFRVINPALLAVVAMLACGAAAAKDPRADACEQQWLEDSGPYVNRAQPDYQSLLTYWKAQEKKCAGTVIYEARLALIYMYLDQTATARRILAAVKDKESPHYHVVEFLSISMEMFEADALPPAEQTAAVSRVRTRLEDFTRRNPQSAEGFNMLGSVLTYQAEYEYALRTLEQAKRVASPEVSKMGLYRNLAIVYSKLDRHRDAIDAGEEALRFTTSLEGDPPFMYSQIHSHVALDLFEEAKKITRVLVEREPAVKQDPEFLATLEYFRTRWEAAKAQPATR